MQAENLLVPIVSGRFYETKLTISTLSTWSLEYGANFYFLSESFPRGPMHPPRQLLLTS
jgi:hypothetical protein